MAKILLDRRFESVPRKCVLDAKDRFLARFLQGTDTFASKTESNKNMQAVSIFRVGLLKTKVTKKYLAVRTLPRTIGPSIYVVYRCT